MAFALLMECRLQLSMLMLIGGVSETCFPQAEKCLNEIAGTDLQKRLCQSLSRQEKYRSLMDWLYVFVFGPRAWRQCHAFYVGKGPLVIELYTPEQIAELDLVVLGAVKLLIQEDGTRGGAWKTYREEARKIHAPMVPKSRDRLLKQA